MNNIIDRKILSKDKSFYFCVVYEGDEQIDDNFRYSCNIYDRNDVLLNSVSFDKKIFDNIFNKEK